MDYLKKNRLWREWINRLQVGSLVHFGMCNGGMNVLILEVMRFTAKQAVCGMGGKEMERFMLTTGKRVGSYSNDRVMPGDESNEIFPKYGRPRFDPDKKSPVLPNQEPHTPEQLQAELLREDIAVLMKHVDSMEPDAASALYNLRAFVIGQLHARATPSKNEG